MCKEFRSPLALPGGALQFRDVVKRYILGFYTCVHLCHLLPHTRSQEALLTSMEVGPNIAHNAALRENVFMMAICIDLKIPLFIIGKPGSSKSLAKSIVTSSMKGAGSSKSFLKCFKEVGTFTRAHQKHDSCMKAL